MKLPALLSDDLHYTKSARTARGLFESLVKNASDFSRFFESAADDETWCVKHKSFMQLSLHWFTNKFFEDHLHVDFAIKVANTMRKHYQILGEWVPQNLTIQIGTTPFPVNSLLWGTKSEWLRQRIRHDCLEEQSTTLVFEDLTVEMFQLFDEYMERGYIDELWSKTEEEILDILKQASAWYLTDLSEECQQLLVKYIDEAKVTDYLIMSQEEQWFVLKRAGIALINRSDIGIRLEDTVMEHFSFEFLNFRKPALDFFENIRQVITHLVCSHRLIDEMEFTDIVHRCPRLHTLSVSESDMFSDRLLDLPEGLKGLNLSKNRWLTHQIIRQIFENSPSLSSLSLGSNIQLNYTAWGLFKLLKSLEKLDISSCRQVNDQDLKVILQAGRGLTHLNLSRCFGLSDLSFFELAKYVPHLVDLNVSGCNIYDAALIDLLTGCKKMTHLNLKRCATLSDKGVLEAIRNAAHLQSICVVGCGLSQATIMKIKAKRPYLVMIDKD